MAAGYDDNHFGSSIALIKLPRNRKLVLSGAPHRRRDTLTGYVAGYLIDHNNDWSNDLKELWSISSAEFDGGAQMGEQFGREIVTGDFNGDGRMDYAVAAPTWSNMELYPMRVNVGRVYIFLAVADSDNIDPSSKSNYRPTQVLQGQASNGQFGFVLQSIDINGDKYDDLVISAPFEDRETGRIYIFNGQPEDNNSIVFNRTASQILSRSGSKWFGHSISVRADLDNNEYNDIAVGAPKSEEIFMYRTRPSVQLNIEGNQL